MGTQENIDIVRKRLGERVKALRVAENLTQERLGLMVGLDRTYILGIEKGRRNVGIDNLTKIAEGLGITLSSLLDGVEDDPEVRYAVVRIPPSRR